MMQAEQHNLHAIELSNIESELKLWDLPNQVAKIGIGSSDSAFFIVKGFLLLLFCKKSMVKCNDAQAFYEGQRNELLREQCSLQLERCKALLNALKVHSCILKQHFLLYDPNDCVTHNKNLKELVILIDRLMMDVIEKHAVIGAEAYLRRYETKQAVHAPQHDLRQLVKFIKRLFPWIQKAILSNPQAIEKNDVDLTQNRLYKLKQEFDKVKVQSQPKYLRTICNRITSLLYLVMNVPMESCQYNYVPEQIMQHLFEISPAVTSTSEADTIRGFSI